MILPQIQELDRSRLSVRGAYYTARLIALFSREATYLNLDQALLERSLELDGIGIDQDNLRLVREEGPVTLDEEKTEIQKLLNQSCLPNRQIAEAHLKMPSDLYLDGNQDHSSSGESRALLQSVLDGIAEELHRSNISPGGLPGGTKNRVAFLRRTGFQTKDEEQAILAAWGFLSAGSHPGLPERIQARLGLVLTLEFGQALLFKWCTWRDDQAHAPNNVRSDNGACIFLIPNVYVLCDKYVMTVRMVLTWKEYHDTP